MTVKQNKAVKLSRTTPVNVHDVMALLWNIETFEITEIKVFSHNAGIM